MMSWIKRNFPNLLAIGLLWAFAMFILVSAFSGNARGQEQRQYSVVLQTACELSAIEDALGRLARGEQVPFSLYGDRCDPVQAPFLVNIHERVGPWRKDADGDWMTAVRVGENRYTIAWPGFNSDLPGPVSI